jgi:RNA polymerase sigma-70 factor (ECF subfamily)
MGRRFDNFLGPIGRAVYTGQNAMTPAPGAITAALSRLGTDGPEAWNDLLPLVYRDLHGLAEAYMRGHGGDGILQPTALVNEAYLSLLRQKVIEWKNRAHFFGVVALLMRRILVDEARRSSVSLRIASEMGKLASPVWRPTLHDSSIDRYALDDALTRLAELDQRQTQVVELRYFGGLENTEIAKVLGISEPTVMRDWRVARAWLFARLQPPSTQPI